MISKISKQKKPQKTANIIKSISTPIHHPCHGNPNKRHIVQDPSCPSALGRPRPLILQIRHLKSRGESGASTWNDLKCPIALEIHPHSQHANLSGCFLLRHAKNLLRLYCNLIGVSSKYQLLQWICSKRTMPYINLVDKLPENMNTESEYKSPSCFRFLMQRRNPKTLLLFCFVGLLKLHHLKKLRVQETVTATKFGHRLLQPTEVIDGVFLQCH